MHWLSNIKVFYKDRLNFWLLNVTGLFVILTWSLFLFKKIAKSDLAVLHYNIYFGFDKIGHWQWLYFIPLIVLAGSIVDFYLSFYLLHKRPIWSHFILTAVALINFMVFLFLYNIINYNL